MEQQSTLGEAISMASQTPKTISVDALWSLDMEQMRRETILDLAALPVTITKMPSKIFGKVLLKDGDMFYVESSRAKSIVLYPTNVQYRITSLDAATGRFEGEML